MTPKEKANELVVKYKDFVHGYVGSSMLTNDEYPEQILSQAKKVAIISANEVIYQLNNLGGINDFQVKFAVKHWEWVIEEIGKLELG